MSYKTILVQLTDPRRARRLFDAVLPMARSMDAHVVGLCVVPPYVVVPASDMGASSVTVDAHREAYQAEMALLKTAFITAVKGEAFQHEWLELDAGFASAASTIITLARAVDLVVTSQRDADWRYSDMLEEPDRIAIESGRPLLLIPNTGKITMPAKRITVAWNGTRESARAVFDALPLLQQADDVNVVWINAAADRDATGDLPAAEICTALVRHGVKCQASPVSVVDTDIGHELRRQASVFGSDLLVMGCYGHTRLREFILGGASRDVFVSASIPVLLSH